ncbi:roadblock/LC7 domain-containing protein [Glycomyces algeriensis]|jgi:predicted regulator of Ras-like GTPase activity (Roadblock/LC7/MglB family)|uniref:Dynein regulation protein LC7 n=1 Tax=Glycomyces algeriensis TaxID=256037 RepID=A0A9W6LE85_9ACTN|nr:roadblock/LC7 domain-containing protein [Glycomyces algeriensis]MDA1366858.1 roadblock/LC7 domain-containing protein [Glycomyces algeriensis]MDR7352756.1 putative regulator of Ras-like GTPase activity (Roadblock/LC7/MglB family) [Glycomyces algeriensis]GLI40438.1 dynein regulation protein LC7 [Glycomyces algeriensis]
MAGDEVAATSDLSWLLASLVKKVPHARSALLLSSDGMKKAHHGLSVDQADQLSAIASGMFSLARSAGSQLGSNGMVRQVIAELDDTLLFVSTAGFGAVLAVTAGREADAGTVGYEMSVLVKSVRPHLETPMRRAYSANGEMVG